MKIGMLWFNNDKKMSLEEVLQQAADYYKRKYRHQPDTCYVSDKQYDLTVNDLVVAGMTVTVKSTIPDKHYQIGVADPEMAEIIHKKTDHTIFD